ncbi:hypothetical protein Ancab_015602 [Ancistrocladus abbreviatus]
MVGPFNHATQPGGSHLRKRNSDSASGGGHASEAEETKVTDLNHHQSCRVSHSPHSNFFSSFQSLSVMSTNWMLYKVSAQHHLLSRALTRICNHYIGKLPTPLSLLIISKVRIPSNPFGLLIGNRQYFHYLLYYFWILEFGSRVEFSKRNQTIEAIFGMAAWVAPFPHNLMEVSEGFLGV